MKNLDKNSLVGFLRRLTNKRFLDELGIERCAFPSATIDTKADQVPEKVTCALTTSRIYFESVEDLCSAILKYESMRDLSISMFGPHRDAFKPTPSMNIKIDGFTTIEISISHPSLLNFEAIAKVIQDATEICEEDVIIKFNMVH